MRYVLYKIYELRVENLSHELQPYIPNLSHERIFILGIYKAWTEQPQELLHEKLCP